MTPKVSIVLSVFNGERFLKDTVESILNQSFSDFEFIIIDDGSVDNTWDLLQYYKKMDARTVLIRNGTNRGETYSINLGIEKARSELIAITQCGAISHRSRLEKQYKWFRENAAYVLVGAQAVYCDVKGRTLWCTSFPLQDKDVRKSLYVGRIIFEHASVMFRRWNGTYYRESLFPEPDFDFWLRASFYGKMRNINEVLTKRIMHDRRISLTRRYEQRRVHWFIHKLFYERLKYGEEQSTLLEGDRKRKDVFERFRSGILHMLARKQLETSGLAHYYYVFISVLLSAAPFKDMYYLLLKRMLTHFYTDKLLRKYIEMGEAAVASDFG